MVICRVYVHCPHNTSCAGLGCLQDHSCFVFKLGVYTTILNAHWASELFAMALMIKQYACGYLSFCPVLQIVRSYITLHLGGI